MHIVLNKQQLANWQARGYLVIPGAFSAAQVGMLREAAADIVAGHDVEAHRTIFSTADRDAGRDEYFLASAQSVHCFLEEGAVDEHGALNRPKQLAINKIGHAPHDRVPAFTQFCRLPVISAVLRDLGLAEPVLWQSMYIYKQPRIGGEVRWHQDASYLHTQPPAVIGMWVALEDAREDNGCLWMAPGAHRSPLRERFEVDWALRKGTLTTLDSSPWPGPGEAVSVPASAGSMVIFSDLMPHYSSSNRSAVSRQAFTLHFSEADVAWSGSNWLQRPDLEPFTL
jgi:phytanoyl-CoA hydroxylase